MSSLTALPSASSSSAIGELNNKHACRKACRLNIVFFHYIHQMDFFHLLGITAGDSFELAEP